MKQSTRVAVGGLSAAISLLFMFMTGMIPFSTYILPAASGVVLIGIAQESGTKTALLVYAAVSLLGLIIVPDRQAILLFILLLGYYPILQPYFQRFPRMIALFLKLMLFNLVILVCYLLMKYVFLIPDAGDVVKIAMITFLAMANFSFLLHDRFISMAITIYLKWFRPKILRTLL